MKDELTVLAKQLSVEDNVVFLGNQTKIIDYLSIAEIYVMPSKTENFPMALLEVMSLGLPCVVTDCMPWRGEDDFIINNKKGNLACNTFLKSCSQYSTSGISRKPSL